MGNTGRGKRCGCGTGGRTPRGQAVIAKDAHSNANKPSILSDVVFIFIAVAPFPECQPNTETVMHDFCGCLTIFRHMTY